MFFRREFSNFKWCTFSYTEISDEEREAIGARLKAEWAPFMGSVELVEDDESGVMLRVRPRGYWIVNDLPVSALEFTLAPKENSWCIATMGMVQE